MFIFIRNNDLNLYFISLLVAIGISNCDERGPRVRRIVGGAPAVVPPVDDPIVYLRFAGKSAAVRGVRDYPHFVFRGIRYAHPPIGKDRFQRPRQYYLNGDVDATKFPPPCLQPVPGENRIIGSEDCLFLNVFTPDLPLGTEGLPVVIWIHGGGFRYGSASQYGVRHLVGKRLVIVTLQYRLGSLGFFGTGTQELPGNSALWDIVMAVQWVRNHIGFFGGNPYQVVVMGHGTGASSALLVTLNDVAKGYTKGVVALSGTAVSHGAVENQPTVTAKDVADIQGCPTASSLIMLNCLQAVPAASIIQGDSRIEYNRLQTRGFVSGLSGRLGSIPLTEGLYDGRSLPPMVDGEPIDKMSSKKAPKIPLLTGITKDETKHAITGQFSQEILTKLKSIPNFLDQVLVKNLQTLTSFGQKENQTHPGSVVRNLLDPLHFRNYISVTKNNFKEGLSKIAEVTADALFSVPAFLTVDLWSKNGAPAFLYSFEHRGKSKWARHFLNGSPLIGNTTEENADDSVGHGEDLAFLFEPRSLDGDPISGYEESFSDEDKKVRHVFTDMISSFARHGSISIDNKEVPKFSSDNNNFMSITTQPKVQHNFRFCQMALWCGLTQRLQSTTCKFLGFLDKGVKTVEYKLFDTVNTVGAEVGLGKPIHHLTDTILGVQKALEGGGIQPKDTSQQTGGPHPSIFHPLLPKNQHKPGLGILGLN